MLLEFKQRKNRTWSQNAQWRLQQKYSIAASEPCQGKSLYRNPGEASSSVSLNREAGGITPSEPLDHHSITRKPICSFCTQPDKLRTKKRREAEETTRSHSITRSLDHSISTSLHFTRSQDGAPEAQFDQWHTRSLGSSFQPVRCQWHIRSQDHDVKIRYIFSFLICFISRLYKLPLRVFPRASAIIRYYPFLSRFYIFATLIAAVFLLRLCSFVLKYLIFSFRLSLSSFLLSCFQLLLCYCLWLCLSSELYFWGWDRIVVVYLVVLGGWV